MNLAKKWWVFAQERFSLASHIPMVGLFVLGNMIVTQSLTSVAKIYSDFPLIFAFTFCFFFRMRCFDEIKDYEVDLKVNPTRPLARGLLSIRQVKIMIGALSVLELFLASRFWTNFGLGLAPLLFHVIAMAYSFLMYKEFFIGQYLRPHLTTYAVTHTFVSTLLGLSVAAQTTGVVNLAMMKTVLIMAPINWSMFNLFEFARKTYAPEEERPTVDTYSSLFGSWGALFLSLSQVVLALIFLRMTDINGFAFQAIGALIPLIAGLYYVLAKTKKSGQIFRAVVGAYLLLFYIGLFIQGYYL